MLLGMEWYFLCSLSPKQATMCNAWRVMSNKYNYQHNIHQHLLHDRGNKGDDMIIYIIFLT